MNRSDFQRLTELRIKETRVLLDAGFYEGAYYLAGYAVECALKACIAKKTRAYDFPDKNLALESYKHDLLPLRKTAGLESEFLQEVDPEKPGANKELKKNWLIVERWSEKSRYETKIAKQDAEDLHSAIIDPRNGVLQWLKKRW